MIAATGESTNAGLPGVGRSSRPYFETMNLTSTMSNETFQKDALNAFAGSANQLGALMHAQMTFDMPEDIVVDALCWRFKDNSVPETDFRRTEFPSWSWCGW